MTLSDTPLTPFVIPYYVGGPLDGGCGAIEPTHALSASIRRAGGSYTLEGFQSPHQFIEDVVKAIVAPDRAVYRWEAAK